MRSLCWTRENRIKRQAGGYPGILYSGLYKSRISYASGSAEISGDAKNIQVRRTGVKEAEVTGKDGESRGQIQKRLYACLLEHPLEIQRIEVPEPSLENLFLEVIR